MIDRIRSLDAISLKLMSDHCGPLKTTDRYSFVYFVYFADYEFCILLTLRLFTDESCVFLDEHSYHTTIHLSDQGTF